MNKETVLANLHSEVAYSEATRAWAAAAAEPPGGEGSGSTDQQAAPFYVQESDFLGEFRGALAEQFIAALQPSVRDYFAELGLSDNELIEVRVVDSYPGSLILAALIIIKTSAPAAYATLKGLSEIDEIAAGLKRQRQHLRRLLHRRLGERVAGDLTRAADRTAAPPPPADPVDVSLSIDPRPLQSLRPGSFHSHRIDIGISLVEDAISIENFGPEPLRNLQLGLFVGSGPRHSWSLADAYRSSLPSLGPQQTTTKLAADFRDAAGTEPDLSAAVYIDCWLEDRDGIYLFRFSNQPAAT